MEAASLTVAISPNFFSSVRTPFGASFSKWTSMMSPPGMLSLSFFGVSHTSSLPLCMIATRSDRTSASCSSLVAKIIVDPSFLRSRSRFQILCFPTTSICAVGSSTMAILGL